MAERALPLLRPYNTTVQHPKLVVVESCASRPEADLAKGALEAAGIQAMIQSDSVGGMREHLAWSGAGFKILVRDEDATDAREVLAPPVEGHEIPDADFQTGPDNVATMAPVYLASRSQPTRFGFARAGPLLAVSRQLSTLK
jgi:hypothetical protein